MSLILSRDPTSADLSRMYYELGKVHARSVGEKKAWGYHPKNIYELLTLAALMSRYDPRLLGVLVEYLSFHWQKLNPRELRKYFLETNEPQIWGVLKEFICPHKKEEEQNYFFDYLVSGLEKAPNQMFFKKLYPQGGYLANRAKTESLQEYLDWGFWGRERPNLRNAEKKEVGHWGKPERLVILKRLFETCPQISLEKYLNELNRSISRQQALKDIQEFPHAQLHGKGRGAYWSC